MKATSMRNAQQVQVFVTQCAWNSLITGHIKSGMLHHALSLYQQLPKDNSVYLSGHTYVTLLKACTKLKDIKQGFVLHADVAGRGLLENDLFIGNTLIDMYTKLGMVGKAQQVFEKLPLRDVISWTALIGGYAENGHCEMALGCFELMKLDDIPPNAATFICSLKACGKVGAQDKGREIHNALERQGSFEKDLFVCSALIDMYAKCGSLSIALQVFDKLLVRDVVSWTTLIAGYVEHGYAAEALNCYQQMQLEGVSPNSATLVCILKACGNMEDIEKGREIHTKVEREGLLGDLLVVNALIDMYTKFGLLASAQEVFDTVPVHDVVSWTALIAGYIEDGQSKKALECFEQMAHADVLPNAITFVCSLKACGCVTAVNIGWKLHTEIERLGLLNKEIVVGNTLVDMYAKCSQLPSAQEVFNRLPVRNLVSWNALITAYAEHACGEEALKCLEQMRCEGVFPDPITYVYSLKACGSIGATGKGQGLHAEIEKQGVRHSDLVVSNTLIDMYGKCGLLAMAQQVFDNLPAKNTVSWNVLMAAYVEHGHGEEALQCFEQMQCEDVLPNAVTYLCSLKACAKLGETDWGREIHSKIERQGLFEGDIVVGNSLVNMYAKCGLLARAQKMFDKLPIQDVTSWNTLMSGYTEQGYGKQALNCFEQMWLQGVWPNSATFVCSLKACSITRDAEKGQEIHAEIERFGVLEKDLTSSNTLVSMYAKCGLLAAAQQVFEKLQVRDSVSWAALTAGYADQGCDEKALDCFNRMLREGFSPNIVAYVCSLKSCAELGAVDSGQRIHAEIERRCLRDKSPVLGTTLVNMYLKSGFFARAQDAFNELPVRSIVTWNVMMAGHIDHGHSKEALKLIELMRIEGISPDAVSFIFCLKACMRIGATDRMEELYAEIGKQGLLEGDVYIGSTLVDMYGKSFSLLRAQEFFDKFAVQNVVVWSTLIDAYTKHGHGDIALEYFEILQLEGIRPDFVIFSCCLNACSAIGAIDKGVEIHGEIEKQGLLNKDLVGNSVVNMYVKCGCLAEACQVFDKLLVHDIVSWTMLMAGYADRGEMDNVFITFNKMLGDGTRPDPIALTVVLNACSMVGLFDKNHAFLEMMTEHHGVVSTLEHYSCVMNFLSHEGRLDEAVDIIKKIPACRTPIVWQTILGFCRNLGIVKLGELAFKHAVCVNKGMQ